MVQPVLTKAVLQPAKATAMCMTCHDYAHQPLPVPLFFVNAKPSSKRIVPTDNMWPKSDDPKKRYWWLKG